MPIEIVQVDAFTDTVFTGNPAAVCLLQAPADAAWMQRLAREMNLSETAFLVRRGEADSFDLRWFTPAVEVDLCGHATLASAHVLWQDGLLAPAAEARFQTLSGRLGARRMADGAIALDFPAVVAQEATPPPALLTALGVRTPRFVGKNRFDWLIELDDEAQVRQVAPAMRSLAALPARGVMVTAAAVGTAGGRSFDFVSRFFAPAAGVDEDPVTGSAHACLGPYWAHKLGRKEVVGHQVSARGGTVTVRQRGARVDVIGQAVTVLRAVLALSAAPAPPCTGA